MNGVELSLLGRTLVRIGEAALPEPPGGADRYAASARLAEVKAALDVLARHLAG
ncbi:hypothetical protein RGF97_06625 [Streptomyces roseicoloratus]|uniref:Uncharacterized protein n=1 Tax=Streptomyces roseicoloratus TaxID=2508722 RepID=A0ABY9RQX1_9ACTN|nr:hypothetical protein [Streptomyces roseicoloratus]WMX44602.1 hypothetical protein RGF97_06625 [Streptomyces roseicoloratus]